MPSSIKYPRDSVRDYFDSDVHNELESPIVEINLQHEDTVFAHSSPRSLGSIVTLRATLIGLLIGTLLVNENMYFFLKSGIGFAGCFTSVLLGFAVFEVLHLCTIAAPSILLREKDSFAFTAEEHAYMVAVAVSAAGGSIAFGFTGPIIAMTHQYVKMFPGASSSNPFCSQPGEHDSILSGAVCHITWQQLLLFCSTICSLGIFVATALRYKLLVKDKLEFPSGTASASLLSALHKGSQGNAEGKNALKTLGLFALPSFLLKVLRYLISGIDSFPIFGNKAACLLVVSDWSTAFIGSAFLIPERVTFSMLAGAALQVVIKSFALTKEGIWFNVTKTKDAQDDVCNTTGLDIANNYALFPSMAMLGVDTIVLFLTAISTSSLFNILTKASKRNIDLMSVSRINELKQKDTMPSWGWILGIIVGVIAITVFVPMSFPGLQLKYTHAFVACIISCVFAVMLMEVYGATDQALPDFPGKIAMLIFSPWCGGVLPALIMCAVAMCCSTQAMDTMMVLKIGKILNVPSRFIIIGQMIGSFASIPIGLASFYLFTSIYEIPGKDFNVPLARIFRALGELAVDPKNVMPSNCIYFVIVFATYSASYHILAFYVKMKNTKKGSRERRVSNSSSRGLPGNRSSLIRFSSAKHLSSNEVDDCSGIAINDIMQSLHSSSDTSSNLDYDETTTVGCSACLMSCLPIPFAVALGMYIPPLVPMDFAVGAIIRYFWRRYNRNHFDKQHSSVAAGLISGEGFAAVVVAIVEFLTGVACLWSVSYNTPWTISKC